jgi:hypothetical protein
MALSDNEIEDIIGDVKSELRSMSAAKQRTITRNRDSLLSWLYDTVRRVASLVGEIISAPFKAIVNAIAGFFEGFFR